MYRDIKDRIKFQCFRCKHKSNIRRKNLITCSNPPEEKLTCKRSSMVMYEFPENFDMFRAQELCVNRDVSEVVEAEEKNCPLHYNGCKVCAKLADMLIQHVRTNSAIGVDDEVKR